MQQKEKNISRPIMEECLLKGFVTQIGAKFWAFEGFLNSGTEQ